MIAKYRIEIERIASRPPTMKVRRTWLFLLAIAFATCRFRFHQYVPSAWETQWSDAARSEVSVDRECDVMSESFHFERAQFTVWQAQRWAKQTVVNARPPRSFALNAVFSRMQLIDEANGGRIVERFIEPLVGILRDPLTMCANFANESVGRFELTEDAVQAKRFLVHDFETINAMPTHGRLILMDLGASTYSGWGPAVSAVGARWFVERFARNTNVTFDRIIAFESVYIPAEEVFRGLPRQLMGRFQYIHLPVSANPSKATHPWTILLSVAKPDDYVIVKLDIDSLHVERALVFQLVHNATFNAIVDELYYENHVNTAAMQMHWGMTDDPVRLKHSYALFRALRDVGIRAHSWP